MEAEQMQKEEQLRRRNPKAHMEMLSGRRERDLRQSQQYVSSHGMPPVAVIHPAAVLHSTPVVHPTAAVHPVIGTPQVRYGAPVEETDDMPCATSMAPGTDTGIESALNALFFASHSPAESPNPGQSKSEVLSSSTPETAPGASVTSLNQTQSSFIAPQHSSETPQFTTHDLQRHINDSTSFPRQVRRDENVIDQPDHSDGRIQKPPFIVQYKKGLHKHWPRHKNGDKWRRSRMTEAASGSKENKGDRKRSHPVDDEITRKRTKLASTSTPTRPSPEAMFDNLLHREASRSFRGGP